MWTNHNRRFNVVRDENCTVCRQKGLIFVLNRFRFFTILRHGVPVMPPNLQNILLLAGVAVLTASLIWHIRLRYQRATRRASDRRAAAMAAREAERKRREIYGESSKNKPASGSRVAPNRIPLVEPFDATFTGGVPPRSIAKWETEIHQIGRQMIGQIDSKSVVLQTLTLEANRAANRLEILIDHLESLLKNTKALQKSVLSTEQPNIIPREESAVAEAFTDVFDELESELDHLHESAQKPIPSATVVKAEAMAGEVPDLALPSVPTPSNTRQPGLALSSLFDDTLVATPEESVLSLPSVPSYQTPLIEQSVRPKSIAEPSRDRFLPDVTAKLDTRSQVETLDNYGYTPKQIAEDLNLTVEEVQLIISLKN